MSHNLKQVSKEELAKVEIDTPGLRFDIISAGLDNVFARAEDGTTIEIKTTNGKPNVELGSIITVQASGVISDVYTKNPVAAPAKATVKAKAASPRGGSTQAPEQI